MVKIFDADLIKNHFIITENGKRILIDTGCPVDINEANIRRFPELKQHLEGARRFVDIGGEKVSIPFGIMPTKVDCMVQAEGAVGIIGIGLYEKFQVLVDLPNRRLVLGKYE